VIREQVQDEAQRFLQDGRALVAPHIVTLAVGTSYRGCKQRTHCSRPRPPSYAACSPGAA
jgi:hypothetical protein